MGAAAKMNGMSEKKVRHLNSFKEKTRVKMAVVVKRLGQDNDEKQEWLVLTPKNKIPQPDKEFFPRPAKRADGSYIYERITPTIAATNAALAAAERFGASSAGGASSAPVSTAGSGAQAPQMLYKKRAYEEKSASSASNEQGPVNKLQRTDGRQHVPNVVPPKGRVATLTRIQGGQRQVISWMDAPDDVFYKATPTTKKLRKKIAVVQIRRAARKPFKKVLSLHQQ